MLPIVLIQGSVFRVQCSGFSVQGLGFSVQGSEWMVCMVLQALLGYIALIQIRLIEGLGFGV